VAALLAAALACGGGAAAAAGQAQLVVSATVPRHASIRIQPPASLTISHEDVARGYVEVPAPIEVQVRSNAPEGYTLVFQPIGDGIGRVVVEGPAQRVVADAAGAVLARPAPARGVWSESLQLRVRFELTAEARPGVQAWPLQVAMMPA
jgi:hypothetical protein